MDTLCDFSLYGWMHNIFHILEECYMWVLRSQRNLISMVWTCNSDIDMRLFTIVRGAAVRFFFFPFDIYVKVTYSLGDSLFIFYLFHWFTKCTFLLIIVSFWVSWTLVVQVFEHIHIYIRLGCACLNIGEINRTY